MGIVLRSSLWIYYSSPEKSIPHALYYTKIYYFTLCRLDELVFGMALAMMQNFHKDKWGDIMNKGNFFLLWGVGGSAVISYLFLYYRYSLWVTTFGYPLLGISFSSLVLAALSPKSYLSKINIPGAKALALWSYTIYLTHKPISVIIYRFYLNIALVPQVL